MKSSLKSTLSLLALGLIAAAPVARSQDAPPPPPPPGDQPPAPGDQPPPPEHPHGHDMVGPLKKALNLTPDQVTQVIAIFGKQREAMESMRDDDSLSDEDRHAKMKELMKSSHDQIRALLTAAQQKTFDAMPPPHWGRPHPTPPPEQ